MVTPPRAPEIKADIPLTVSNTFYGQMAMQLRNQGMSSGWCYLPMAGNTFLRLSCNACFWTLLYSSLSAHCFKILTICGLGGYTLQADARHSHSKGGPFYTLHTWKSNDLAAEFNGA